VLDKTKTGASPKRTAEPATRMLKSREASVTRERIWLSLSAEERKRKNNVSRGHTTQSKKTTHRREEKTFSFSEGSKGKRKG